jgi:hypothetical protein
MRLDPSVFKRWDAEDLRYLDYASPGLRYFVEPEQNYWEWGNGRHWSPPPTWAGSSSAWTVPESFVEWARDLDLEEPAGAQVRLALPSGRFAAGVGTVTTLL